jgi:hypothetical protein
MICYLYEEQWVGPVSDAKYEILTEQRMSLEKWVVHVAFFDRHEGEVWE